jgi:hypothetical protein
VRIRYRIFGGFDEENRKGEKGEGRGGLGIWSSRLRLLSCVCYILYVGVVSLKGGDYVVRFTYNRGVLKGEMVRLLEPMELSVDSILENS